MEPKELKAQLAELRKKAADEVQAAQDREEAKKADLQRARDEFSDKLASIVLPYLAEVKTELGADFDCSSAGDQVAFNFKDQKPYNIRLIGTGVVVARGRGMTTRPGDRVPNVPIKTIDDLTREKVGQLIAAAMREAYA